MSTRPAQNPITVRGNKNTSDSTKVGVTFCRLDTEGKPHDGQNRVGKKYQVEPSVVITTFIDDEKDFKVTQTVVLKEEHLISGLLLLFPDILVEKTAVTVASLRELLFTAARPKIEGG